VTLVGLTLLTLGVLVGSVGHPEEPAQAPAPAASDGRGPGVRFVIPADGQFVSGLVRIVIEATHSQRIDQVSVSQGSSVFGIDLEPPFEWTWDTRREADGPYALVAKALDADFREGSARISVTVDNTPPTAVLTAPRDGSRVTGTVQLEVQASDVIGVQAVRFLANGVAVGEITSPPYVFDWHSQTVPNTRCALQARVFDRAHNSVTSAPVTVRVANFNRYPILNPIGPKTIAEGLTLAFTVEASDPDGRRDPLTYRADHLPPWATFDPNTREFRGAPDSSEASVTQPRKEYPGVRFEVCDPEPLCDHEELAMTVLDHNYPPVVELPGDQSVSEGEPLAFQVLARDPDGDPMACKTRLLPKWASFDASTCHVEGVPGFDVASLEEPNRVYTNVQFEFCDSEPLCASEAMTITVINVNAAPVWGAPAAQQGEEDRRLAFEVSATDPDGDRPILTGSSLPEGAQLTDLGDGTGRFTWTPRGDHSGRHEITLVATDGDLSASASVPITIRERIHTISGVVADRDGKPAPGVTIELTAAAASVKSVTTDKAGFYLVSDLRPGKYVVRPSLAVERVFSPTGKKLKGVSFVPPLQRIRVTDVDRRHVNFVIELE
jgi:hypothetical protein